MVGSLAAALGPACLRFLRPIRVVGCGGGSYLGFSFYGETQQGVSRRSTLIYLLLLFILASTAAGRLL
jgi:hypothetical protein